MRAEVRCLGGFVGDRHRVIQVHPDFFDDHLLLGLEVVLPKRGAKDVGQDVEGRGEIFRQASDVIEGVFLGGLRVVLGADPVEVAIHGQGVATWRSLESHVLEKVRDPGQVGHLVAAARLHKEAGGDRVGPVVQLGDDLETVFQRHMMKRHQSWPVRKRMPGSKSNASAAAGDRLRQVLANENSVWPRFCSHVGHTSDSTGNLSAVGPSVRIVRSRMCTNPAA